MECNFEDAQKIRAMLNEKYVNFDVKEERCPFSSLNTIRIFFKGQLVLTLEPSIDGYIIKNIGDYVLLKFVADLYRCFN